MGGFSLMVRNYNEGLEFPFGEGKPKQWQQDLQDAVQLMIIEEFGNVPSAHTKDTPARVVKTYLEYIKNLNVDISQFFEKPFPVGTATGMVIIKNVNINSLCSHHLFPFFGKAHFGYVPDAILIGLSKIPRFIEVLSKRPSLQEKLCDDITAHFNNYVKPLGCGIVMEAVHTCMTARGVEAHGAITRYTSLVGCFLDIPSVKQEFLDGIK
jgi:GTP cyclohydrolase I